MFLETDTDKAMDGKYEHRGSFKEVSVKMALDIEVIKTYSLNFVMKIMARLFDTSFYIFFYFFFS